MRAFLLVLSDLEVGTNKETNSLLNLDMHYKLRIPTLRKMGIFKCAGETEEFIKPISFYGKVKIADKLLVEQFGEMIDDASSGNYDFLGEDIPESILSKIKEIFRCEVLCGKRGVLQNVINEYGEFSRNYSSPIVYTKENKSIINIAVHENCYSEKEFFSLVEMVRNEIKDYNIRNVVGKIFAGEYGNFYKTQHYKEFRNDLNEDNLLVNLEKKGVNCVSVGKVLDFINEKHFYENYPTRTDALALKIFEKLTQRKEDLFAIIDLADYGQNFISNGDMLSARQSLEAIDQSIERVLPRLNEDDLLIITSDYLRGHEGNLVPILIYGLRDVDNATEIGTFNDFRIVSGLISEHFNL